MYLPFICAHILFLRDSHTPFLPLLPTDPLTEILAPEVHKAPCPGELDGVGAQTSDRQQGRQDSHDGDGEETGGY